MSLFDKLFDRKKYKKAITKNNTMSIMNNNDVCQQLCVRIAEAYDGAFTEFYVDLLKEDSCLKLRERSYHYNANHETLIKEVIMPENLRTFEDIFFFIYANTPEMYGIDIDTLKVNNKLIKFIFQYLQSSNQQ